MTILTPVSIYRDASIELDSHGSPTVHSGRRLDWLVDCQNINAIDIIFRDPHFIGHYFHFMEITIAAFSMIATFIPLARVRRIYFGSQNWNNPSQNFIQQDVICALFAPEKIVSGKPEGVDAILDIPAIFVDRDGTTHSEYNKYIEQIVAPTKHIYPLLRSKAIDYAIESRRNISSSQFPRPLVIKPLLKHIYGALRRPKTYTKFAESALGHSANDSRQALYVKRKPPRTFTPDLEAQFIQKFADYGIKLEVIDFSEMTWAEQVISTSSAQLLVGIHGNGLTNCLWMPPGATVIEIFPANVHHYDYQMLSEVAGLKYFGVEGRAQNPFVFTGGARFGGAYGYPGEPVLELPWPWLDQILHGLDLKF